MIHVSKGWVVDCYILAFDGVIVDDGTNEAAFLTCFGCTSRTLENCTGKVDELDPYSFLFYPSTSKVCG